MKQELKNLEYIVGDDIFKNLANTIYAFTTQSRLRREKANISDWLDELENELGGEENLVIENYVEDNNLVIDMDLLTTTPPKNNQQGIIDGWSRIDMNLTFLLACLLYSRSKSWESSSSYKELQDMFLLNGKLQWRYLDDSNKLDIKRQVNYLLGILVNGKRDINIVKNYSKESTKHQINLFCIHIYTCYTRLKKWKVKSPEQLKNVYDNVLKGQKFCTKFVPEGVDSSKHFYNKNIKAVNLTPECEDAVIIFNDRDKYSLPNDNTIYEIIDDYVQDLGYWIREGGEMVNINVWYNFLIKSQISFDANKSGRNKETARKKFRNQVGEALKEQYVEDKKSIIKNNMIAKLDELTYTTDFENIHKLRNMNFSKNIWPLCLLLMREGKFDSKVQRYLYWLTRHSNIIDTLWKNWDDDWLYPLLLDSNLITKPIQTIHNHLVLKTFNTKYDIRVQYASDRVTKKIKPSERSSLATIDYVQGLTLGGQYGDIRVYLDSVLNRKHKYVDSIEHIASQNSSDPNTECVDLGGNQYFAGKQHNSSWNNKDYVSKRSEYKTMQNDLPTMLSLVMFGSDGMKIHKDFKDICEVFNNNYDVGTLDEWNLEVTKRLDENKFYKFHKFMADRVFDLKYITKVLSL